MKLNNKQKVHFIHPHLINPQNPITVNIYGAGATGSYLTESLERVNFALIKYGHAGFQLNLFDPNKVREANFGRSAFNQNEVGMNKAVSVINRNNGWYGTNWKAHSNSFEEESMDNIPNNRNANITISCVDSVKSRFNIADYLYTDSSFSGTSIVNRPLYWIDFGNSRNTGQVQFATVGDIKQPISKKFNTVPNLMSITEEYGKLLWESEDKDTTSSCSFLEANESQDLFTNSILAVKGADMLWKMLRNGLLTKRGFFENLETGKSEAIPL